MMNKKQIFIFNMDTSNIRLYFLAFLNALASFQGYINKILAEKLGIFIIVYLNNILIYIKDLN